MIHTNFFSPQLQSIVWFVTSKVRHSVLEPFPAMSRNVPQDWSKIVGIRTMKNRDFFNIIRAFDEESLFYELILSFNMINSHTIRNF